MSGNVTTLAGTSFTRSVMRVPPTVSRPVLWAFIGTSLAASPNLIAGQPQLVNVGTGPLWPPPGNYARLTYATAGLLFPVSDVAGSVSVMFVARTIDSTGLCSGISNFNTSPNQGFDSYLGNSTAGGGFSIYNPGVSGLTNMAQPRGSMEFKFYAAVFTAGTGTVAYNQTDGLSQSWPGTGTRTVSASQWLLGDSPVGSALSHRGTNMDMAFAAICQGALDATTVANVYQSVRETLALTGMRI
jgi:hypothetical protein